MPRYWSICFGTVNFARKNRELSFFCGVSWYNVPILRTALTGSAVGAHFYPGKPGERMCNKKTLIILLLSLIHI